MSGAVTGLEQSHMSIWGHHFMRQHFGLPLFVVFASGLKLMAGYVNYKLTFYLI
jgi:hypothetical protein